jgi:DMSO/TMAO reductase YedYZ molybdopterin-dependent catalytic subunit
MDDTPHRGGDRIPPGQYVTEKWPVLTYGRTPVVSPKDWGLRIFGSVEQPVALRWAALQELPRREVKADFHCVTRFSTLDNRWSGFSTRDVLMQARVLPEATYVSVHCYGGYATNLPLEDFLSEHALFADRWNGEPLAVDHGGPVRLVVPHLYAWKSAKWVSGVEVLAEDRRGFWEENGYHAYGDPWTEERFSSQETRNAGQVRRRAKELGIVPEETQGQLPNSSETP